MHKVVLLDLYLTVMSHRLLAGGCDNGCFVLHEMTLARSLRALKLVADLSQTFVCHLENSFLCGTPIVAIETSID